MLYLIKNIVRSTNQVMFHDNSLDFFLIELSHIGYKEVSGQTPINEGEYFHYLNGAVIVKPIEEQHIINNKYADRVEINKMIKK